MSEDTGGPYVTAAVLCEKVIEEKDGVLSVIRIVDRIVISAGGMGAPEEMPQFPVNLTALLTLKSGNAKGKYNIRLKAEPPPDLAMDELSFPIYLEGEDRGSNLIINMNFQVRKEGLYWFSVYLNEDFVTKIPLRIMYQRISVGAAPRGRLPH